MATLTVPTRNGDTGSVRAVYAAGPLAVTKMLGMRNGWSVTHVPSGMLVAPQGRSLTLAGARKYRALLLSLPVDWSQARPGSVAAERDLIRKATRHIFAD